MKHVRLLALVLRSGRIRPRGVDFSKRRRKALETLMTFVPAERPTPRERQVRLVRNSWLAGLAGQVAFLMRSLKPRGGHLAAAREKLCYIRIPRAASTSLSYAMLAARYPALRGISVTAEQINSLTDVNLEVNIAEDVGKTTFFTVVRNPFSRLVSVYREFFERPSQYFLYEDYLFGILKKGFSFREFVKTLEKIPSRFMDQHIRPQQRFLSFYQEKNIDVRIFKLEDREPLGDFLASHGLGLETLNQSEVAYDYRDYYDSEILRIAGKIYLSDLLLFGYQHEYEILNRLTSDKK